MMRQPNERLQNPVSGRRFSKSSGDGRVLDSTSEALKSGADETTLNLLKIISHDIRGPLVSMVATLKLLNRGYYGKMDEKVADKIREVLSNATRLAGMAEEYLGRAFAVNEELEIEGEPLYSIRDIVNPVLEEFSPGLKDRRKNMKESQR
jgi:K+-sensing histidine kinase KdpD